MPVLPRDRVKGWRQPPPYAVQIELVEGCQLRCNFCGLNGIRGKENDFKFMSLGLACDLAYKIKQEWGKSLPRIEFAMHGEPSFHPELVEAICGFRQILGKKAHLMMTSNGGGFLRDPIRLVDGVLEDLNVLALDWYEGVKIVPKLMEAYRAQGSHIPSYYPQDPMANPHRRRKPDEHDLVIVQDIEMATMGTHSVINNHAGCGAPKVDVDHPSQFKRCAKPFREMSIRWDGSVAICCNDWRGEFKCGSVASMALEEVWNGEAMQAARKYLYHGQRTIGPCKGCDALSYRTGLLPDKFGKVKLPPPSEEDRAAVERALGGASYTPPVRRVWELPVVKE